MSISLDINPTEYYRHELEDFNPKENAEWILAGKCPFHADLKSGNFCFNSRSGAYRCHRCGAFGGSIIKFHSEKYGLTYSEAKQELAKNGYQIKALPSYHIQKEHCLDVKKLANLESFLKHCLPLDNPASALARLYFTNRGLADISEDLPTDIYFHPAVSYYEEGTEKKLPAIIGKVTDLKNELVTLQKIYLSPDGNKAKVNTPKKFSPSIGRSYFGASVKMYSPTKILGVCEGIETALAIRCITRMPIWSALTADMLARIALPDNLEKVIIYADHDSSEKGAYAAMQLYKSLTQKNVEAIIIMPPHTEGEKSTDWLDFYIEKTTNHL